MDRNESIIEAPPRASLCAVTARHWSVALCLTIAVLILAHSALGQTGVGQIVGSVKDPTGAVIPNASVVARNEDTGAETKTVTSAKGGYIVPNLQPGTYSLTTSATGFATLENRGLVVLLGQSLTLDNQLQLGASTQNVTVSTAAVQIDTTSSHTADARTNAEIDMLPAVLGGGGEGGRDALAFMSSEPGVVYLAGGNSVIQGVGDTSSLSNVATVAIDGVSQASQPNHSQNIADVPSPDVIQEFSVSTNPNADTGWNLGASIDLTSKSGTNALHGAAYDYLRNDVLDSRSYFGTGVNPEKRNDFGGSISGPIIRNRAFYFLNYEGVRFRSNDLTNLATVPTVAMKQGDFSGLLGARIGTDALGRPVYQGEIYDPSTTRQLSNGTFVRDPFTYNGNLNVIPPNQLSSISAKLQTGYPAPTSPATLSNWRGPQSAKTYQDSDRIYAKTDVNITQSHKLSFTFDYAFHNTYNTGNPCIFDLTISTCALTDIPQMRLHGMYIWTIRPNLVLGVTAGYNRDGYGGAFRYPQASNFGATAGLTGVSTPDVPKVNIQNYTGFGGNIINIRANQTLPSTVYLSWLKGRHNIKFGVDHSADWTPNQVVQSNSSGSFTFSGLETNLPGFTTTTGWGYASYLLGVVDSSTLQLPKTLTYTAQAFGLYAQDQWRVTDRLSVNYGLRYDIQLPYREGQNRIGNFDPTVLNPAAGNLPGALSFYGVGPGRNGRHRIFNTDWLAFGPRLGIAYQLDRSTVVRAYYGIQRAPVFFFDNGGISFSGGNLGWGATVSASSSNNGVTPAFNWNNGFPVSFPNLPNLSPSLINGSSVQYVDPNADKVGLAETLGFAVERQLSSNIIVHVGYVGNLQHNLINYGTLVNRNQLDPKYFSLGTLLVSNINSAQAKAAGIPVPYTGFNGSVAQALLPYPQFAQNGIPQENANVSNTLYHALEVGVQQRMRYGLSIFANYTFAKNLSTASTTPQETVLYNTWKQLAPFDVTQIVHVSFTYGLPFGPDQRFLAHANPVIRQLVAGWVTSGIVSVNSGTPIVLHTNQTIPGAAPIWANRVPGVAIGTAVSCRNYAPGSVALNINAFATPPAYTFGNIQTLRNRSCGNQNTDLSINKRFPIREGHNLEFGVDFFNAFNNHYWTGLQANVSTPTTFGVYNNTTGPRIIQGHLKYRF